MSVGVGLLASGAKALCGAVDRLAPPRVSILGFHRVNAVEDPLVPETMTAASFDAICRWLASTFNVMTLGDALASRSAGTLPERALVITFDDGYADNAEVALPILRRHGLPATFFIATGFLDGGRMFNDTVIDCLRRTTCDTIDLGEFGLGQRALRDTAERRAVIDALLPRLKHLQLEARDAALRTLLEQAGQPALRNDLMMRSGQVQELHRAGMEIGGHTVNHPILQVLGDADAEREIDQGRRFLENLIQAPVPCFAYPNGRPNHDYGARDVALVRKLGFRCAVSTAAGVVTADTDLFQLPRYTPFGANPLRWLARLTLMRMRGAAAGVV